MPTKHIDPKISNIIGETFQEYNVQISNDYSGRFMFGKLCFSVSGDYKNVENFLCNLVYTCGKKGFGQIREIMENKYQDQLGFGIVVYFPNYSL